MFALIIGMIKIITEKIKIDKRYSDDEIARLCGVTRMCVWYWRHGCSRPSEKNMQKLRKLAK
jgi:hypothetical protein